MNKELQVGSGMRAAVLLLALLTAVFAAWACVEIEMLFAAVGLVTLLIVLAPFLFLKSYDLFCPWSFVILAIAVLSTPQAICMSFSFPSVEIVNRMMLLGREPAFFIFPAGIFLLGVACLTIGYFGFVRKEQKAGVRIARGMHPRNTVLVLLGAIMLSILSTAIFVRVTGGFESGRISDKRTNIQTLDVANSDTKQYGHFRQTSKLSAAAFLVLYSFILCRYERPNAVQNIALAVALMAAIALPFYASSRSQVLWVGIGALGVNYYLGRGSFWLKCATVGGLGLSFFLLMSVLRNTDSDDALASATLSTSFEKLVLNRNGPGLSKTAHIINSIPDRLEFKYGSTFAEWILAPIPRAIFPGKPMIGTGPEVGTKVYGTKFSGVPPGYIAELYWNFYIPGVVFGMLLLGVFLNRLYWFFRSMQVQREIVVPVYLFSVMPIAFTVLGNSLGFGTMMRLVDFVTVGLIVYGCSSSLSAITNSVGHVPVRSSSSA